MQSSAPFVDIHCHLIPGIDDGSKSWDESIAMANMAVADGIETIIVTPHQLGNFAANHGDKIRESTIALQDRIDREGLQLTVLPGGDVRIDNEMLGKILSGEVLTLGDHKQHVLLELPHELYFPLGPVLRELEKAGIQGILSHPERNQGLLAQPQILAKLVDQGCLMQVTAGSLLGGFGPASKALADSMLQDGLVHFLATDAHGSKSRRPRMGRAFFRVVELVGEEAACDLCCHHPAAVAGGAPVPAGRRPAIRSSWTRFFAGSRAA